MPVRFITKHWPVIALTLVLSPLYVFLASQNFMWRWDESLHVLVARNFTEHWLTPTLIDDPVLLYDYRDWMGNHVWLVKPPLGLWIGAVGIELWGVTPFGYHFGGIFLLLASSVFTYFSMYSLVPRTGYALLAGFLEGTSFVLLLLMHGWAMDLVDLSLAATLHMGLYGVIRTAKTGRGALWIGCATGLGFLAKSYLGLLPLAVMILLSPRQWRGWGKAVIIAFALAAPWNIYSAWRWPVEFAHENLISLSHLWSVVEEHGGGRGFYGFLLPYYTNIAVLFLPLVLGFGKASISFPSAPRAALGLFLYFVLPFLVLSEARTKMDNFIIVMTPPIALWLSKAALDLEKERWLRMAFLSAMILGSFAGAAVSIYRASDPFHQNQIRCARELIATATETYPGKDVVFFNTGHVLRYATMAMGEVVSYRHVPAVAERQHVLKEGYQPIVIGQDLRPACLSPDRALTEMEPRPFETVGRVFDSMERSIKKVFFRHRPLRRAVFLLAVLALACQGIVLWLKLHTHGNRRDPGGGPAS